MIFYIKRHTIEEMKMKKSPLRNFNQASDSSPNGSNLSDILLKYPHVNKKIRSYLKSDHKKFKDDLKDQHNRFDISSDHL